MEVVRKTEDVDLSQQPPRVASEEVIVRADEIDEGALTAPELSVPLNNELDSAIDPDAELEVADAALADHSAIPSTGTLRSPVRPILQRDSSAPRPPPPRQPPPPAPPAQPESVPQPTDSLSLGQLKNIVAHFPRLEPVAYAYVDEDTRTFPEELEEWFQYTQEDRDLIEDCKVAFEKRFAQFLTSGDRRAKSWLESSLSDRLAVVQDLVDELGTAGTSACLESLQCLGYVVMGVWRETTAQAVDPSIDDEPNYEPPNQKYRRTVAQQNCIHESARLLCQARALPKLYTAVRHICDYDTAYDPSVDDDASIASVNESHDGSIKNKQLSMALTIIYFMLESGRHQLRKSQDSFIREAFMQLQPSVLDYFSQMIAKIRWEDNSEAPFTKIILVLWKSVLLVLGDSAILEGCKKSLSQGLPKDDQSILTTSPLDYHIFRQEITSKYPAYNPPPPLIPIEINNNSMLPPQPSLDSRTQSQDNLQGLENFTASNSSIFHQPVHIATPAPSPPPSPAGPGGKGGKKQNYQTNQNFPFLYPPLDSTSNELGGKGKTEMQDKLVGKRWEGGDVPASIVEAGQLFASRMRMSRALRQLWDVREEFVRFERGWEDDPEPVDLSVTIDKEFGELELNDEPSSEDKNDESEVKQSYAPTPKTQTPETDDLETSSRLDATDAYFVFPQLQSMVIVLLKILLSNVTTVGNSNGMTNGAPAATDIDDSQTELKPLPKKNINLSRQLSLNGQQEAEHDHSPLEELNSTRTREITSKAVSAFLLTMLKWFRLSHVLKFEYVTQLLLDSNYVPLALKYFALQDIDKAVDLKNDYAELDFFYVCCLLAGNSQSDETRTSPHRRSSSSSADSAAPPPIARHHPSSTSSSLPPSPGSPASPPRRPEVDELGYPTTALPPQPLTTYAPRFFHTYITTLRLLQKLTKGHAHRALLLVQFKSSTILRKALKVPQPSLRLYTLKLFKTQVPFCGRKWRQTNMRVITAIYVFCRMGLRDDWISGGGQVEELVESAVSTESAWRGLVGWWLARNYRKALVTAGSQSNGLASVGGSDEMTLLAKSQGSGVFGANCGEDFFARELEKMGWGMGTDEVLEDEEGEWGEWDGGPLELDGW